MEQASADAVQNGVPQNGSPASEPVAQSAQASDPSADHDSTSNDSDAGDSDDAGAETASGDATSPGKRKRRRRKKKGGAEAKVDGAEPNPSQRHDAKAKRPINAPFGKLFEGQPRKHAFAAGEVVAGRVSKVEGGVFWVDLFGKAVAVVDIFEPRNPPHIEVEQMRIDPPAPVADVADAKSGAEPVAETSAERDERGRRLVRAVERTDGTEPTLTGGESAVDETAATASSASAEELAPPPAAETTPGMLTSPGAEYAPHVDPVVEDADDDEEDQSEALAPEPAEEIVAPTVGSIFRGRIGAISESGHIAIVNRMVDVPAAKDVIIAARENRTRVRGIVFGYNRGGFDVLVEGLRAFCPASGMSLTPIDNPEEYVGQKLEFLVPLPREMRDGRDSHQERKRGDKKGGEKTADKSPVADAAPAEGIDEATTEAAPSAIAAEATPEPKPEAKTQEQKRNFKGPLLVSRRSILDRARRKATIERVRNLKVGERLHGRIVQHRDFGVFVDLGGGLEGLVHLSELSWDRGARMSDVAKIGEEFDFSVVKLPEKRGERVLLSLKATQDDPWVAHKAELVEGSARKGKVVRVAEFGAFVELVPGIDGLLHVSELGKELKHAKEAIKEGDIVNVVIERVDRGARRISLSKLSAAAAAQLAENPDSAASKSAKAGGHTKVVVERIEHHGVFVQVKGVLGKRGRGYIPNNEMGTERGTDHKKQFPVGTELDVKVIGTERDGGLKCSRKGFYNDEERRAVLDYRKEAAKSGFGTFGDILRSKIDSK